MSTKVAENPQNHWKIGKPYGFIRKIGKSLEKLENASLSNDLCIFRIQAEGFPNFPMIFQFFQ